MCRSLRVTSAPTRALARTLPLVVVFIATGCSSIKTGYFSAPFVGEAAPGVEAAASGVGARHQMRHLSLPGLTLYINLMNDVDTSNAPWIGMGERRVVRSPQCILLDLRPGMAGISLEPKLVSLSINGASHAPQSVRRYIGTGSRFEELTEPRLALAQDQWTRLGLCFPEAAAPDQDIALDLSQALRHPDQAPFPPIRFAMRRFRHVYY